MTIKEANNFYKQDKKEYILSTKVIINKWLKDIIEKESIDLKNVKYPENYKYVLKEVLKHIYESIKDIKDLQKLVDFIVTWYEIKYPNNEFELDNGIIYIVLNDKARLAQYMDVDELIKRLNKDQKAIMICGYRAGGWSSIPIRINKKKIRDYSIFFSIDVTNTIGGLNNDYSIPVNADYKTGLVDLTGTLGKELTNIIDEKYIMRGYINLDELYNELSNSDINLDFNSLKSTILDRKLMLKIREHILELAALKLLYSKNTIPEYGYERAKRFIKEFNKELNTNLTTDRIDEIMNKDYKNSKKLAK